VPNRYGLTSASQALDTTSLVDRKANGCFRSRKGRESSVWPAAYDERSSNYPVRMAVDKMIRGVSAEDIYSCNTIRAREDLNDNNNKMMSTLSISQPTVQQENRGARTHLAQECLG
jgi:hypothetical protein